MRANPGIRTYIRKLRRHLICKRATKDKLLEGFVQELCDAESADHPMSYESLCRSHGQPKAMAREFQEQVTPKEYQATRHRRTIALICALTIGACLVAWWIFLLYDTVAHVSNVNITETIIIHE